MVWTSSTSVGNKNIQADNAGSQKERESMKNQEEVDFNEEMIEIGLEQDMCKRIDEECDGLSEDI